MQVKEFESRKISVTVFLAVVLAIMDDLRLVIRSLASLSP